ncbi:MAG: hypothetical protein ABEJ27_04400 [Halodesulfurarchaeum sp.]
MSLDTQTWRRAGITLVAVIVRNTRTDPVRVRVEDRLGGPIWPPRGRGRPEPGWTDSGFEGRVDGEASRSFGYATPARPTDPVAELVEMESVESRSRSPDPEAMLTAFDDPRPPRSVLSSFASIDGQVQAEKRAASTERTSTHISTARRCHE